MKKIITFFIVIQSVVCFGQTVDSQGRKQGYWKKKDEKTNKLLYEGEFKDGKPVGVFKYYYPNDSVRAIMSFKNDGKEAYAKLFHMNGKKMAEGKYVGKEVKDSVWTYFDEAAVMISKETYKMGKKNGASYVYLPDGKVSEQRTWKMDLEDGPFKQYFDGVAVKAAGNYVNGKMEGRVMYYYPNGVEVAAGYYKNGEKNGPWIYKTESGKVREKELYKNGKLASPKETEEFFSKAKTQTEDPKKPGTANKESTSKGTKK